MALGHEYEESEMAGKKSCMALAMYSKTGSRGLVTRWWSVYGLTPLWAVFLIWFMVVGFHMVATVIRHLLLQVVRLRLN